MQGFAYLKDVTTLQLDRAACDGCRTCVAVCPHQVFAMEEKRARIVARDACMECGACQLNCSKQAITVDSGVGCAAGLIQQWLNKRSGKAATGCC